MLRQDRQPAEDQRQLAVLVRIEVEHDAARALHHHVLHVRHLDAEARPALLQQRAIGPRHVLGGDRRAVGEFRLGPQLERHPHLVGRQLDGLVPDGRSPMPSRRPTTSSRLSHTCPTLEPEPEPPGSTTHGLTMPSVAVPRRMNGLKLS